MLRKLYLKTRINLVFIFFILFNYSCENAKDITELNKSYYFPVKTCIEPIVYCFYELKDSSDTKYWLLQSKFVNNDTFLITKMYDKNFILTDELEEEISQNESVLKKFDIYNPDGTKSQGDISSNKIFVWNQKPGENINWKVTFDFLNSDSYILLKNREYVGKTENFSFNNSQHPSILFFDSFEMIISGDNSNVTRINYNVQSTYSKGIGLTNFVIEANGKSQTYFLKKVLPIKAWEEMLKFQNTNQLGK